MSLRVEVSRGGLVETLHPVSAVLVEGGQVRWSVGEDLASFWRSASKPFQLWNSLAQLPADAVAALDDRQLAVGAASHNGEPGHVGLVQALLARFGLAEAGLQCGAHVPSHEPSARLVREALSIHNNCSGKHTFMLAACAARGWDLDYRALSHPLQAANHTRLDELGGVHHGTGIDGCSVPTFHGPLSAFARAWSTLAGAMADEDGTLGRIGRAMSREPWSMSGTNRLDLAVVEQIAEPVAVKIGAEGLFCVAIPRRRAGLAVKVHSGNSDVLAVAVRAVLEQIGVPTVGSWHWDTVKNVRGAVVGERRPVWGAA